MLTSFIVRVLSAASSLTAALATTTSSAASATTSIVPNIVNGYANESAAIVPIDESLARSVIPANYSIMTKAYESLIPNWPKGKYPAVFSLAYETNDTANGELVVSNLTRVAIRFPFVDRLGIGIPFRFANIVVIQAPESNIIGSSYLQQSLPGTFEPRDGGYAAVPGTHGQVSYSTAWNGTDQAQGKPPSWEILLKASQSAKYPIEVFRNVTSQPLFGGGSVPDLCLIYNYDQSSLENPPTFTASVSVKPPYLPKAATYTGISGVHIPAAFEEIFTSCESVPGMLTG